MSADIQAFADSFERIDLRSGKAEAFFDAFYAAFMATSPQIAEKFRGTDMARQKYMLRVSLDHMVYFAIDRQETEAMARVAAVHSRAGANITADLYDLWLDSLLATVARFDPAYDSHVDAAWRQALAPGIAYMRARYDGPIGNDSSDDKSAQPR